MDRARELEINRKVSFYLWLDYFIDVARAEPTRVDSLL
jgi:hypothetical protein